jgi:dephospho-CoA kinase
LKVIGLTGGIGSGKSTVAGFLEALGAVVIDLDRVGHEALKKGGRPWQDVVDAFGKGILAPDGEIDRSKLGDIVFRDRESLMRLNRIIHPVIDSVVAERVEEGRRRGVKALVFEAAALIESGKIAQVEEIWVTVAPEHRVLERLKERSGYSRAESLTRIRSQLTNQERVGRADVVIDTDCTLDELRARVKTEWEKLLRRV